MFNDKTILVTGGTGSFGSKFTELTLDRFKPKKIIILSRDEMKQWEMAKGYKNDTRVRFFIGDIKDKERLYRAMDGVDYVVHAAATKIVPTAEYNPFECVKTNIIGGMNVIDACIDKKVKYFSCRTNTVSRNPIPTFSPKIVPSVKSVLKAEGNIFFIL